MLVLAGVLASVMINSRAELPRHPAAVLAPVVHIVEVRPGPVQVQLKSQGTVTSQREIKLISEVSGKVIWVAPQYLTGALVEAGMTLLKIDPIDYQVGVSDAAASLASAEFALAEATVLIKRAAVKEAEALVAAAKDRLRKAKIDLDRTDIVAPFNAVIDRRHVDIGQYIGTGTVMMDLLGSDIVEVRLPVLAADLPFLRFGPDDGGNWPTAVLSARFGELVDAWQARLVRVENRIDTSTRVFYLVAEVEQPYRRDDERRALTVGLFVEANIPGIIIDRAVRLPRSALHDDGTVFVVVEGELLQRRKVRLARVEDDSVILDRGLGAGDRVVVSRLGLMVDSMVVRISEDRRG